MKPSEILSKMRPLPEAQMDEREVGAKLRPCPICGAGSTDPYLRTMWNGKRSEVLSLSIRHWCERSDGEPVCYIDISGKNIEAVIERWNKL